MDRNRSKRGFAWRALAVCGLTAVVAGTTSGMASTGSAGKVTAATAGTSLLRGLKFTDVAGKSYGAQDVSGHKATVFLFISSQCPICNVYAPRFAALAEEYGKRDVPVYGIYPDVQESVADVVKSAQEHGLTFPVVKDAHAALVDRLGATMTPEAILVDATGAVRYRGRIDDNAVSTRVSVHDLDDAVNAVLAGTPVAHPQVLAFGCAIRRGRAPAVAAKGVPTYAHDVAPILRAKCENCHRPGQVAPFSLQTYSQASAWARDIERYTQNGQMPPWKPAPGYGEFLDEHARSLSDAERTVLAKWADGGAPLGDPKKVPAPAHFAQGWQLGQPDMILESDKDFHLGASGDDVYRNFVIKTDFPEDRYVSAVECHPGNRAVVHHVIIYVDGNRASEKLDGKDHDGEPGFISFGGPGFLPTGMLGGWAPGNDPHFLPDGIGNKVPKGALLVLQVHYHKDGKPETDRSRIGLYFCKGPVDKQVAGTLALNFFFQLPPGDPHYKVTATTTINEDQHILAVMPHMHLLGRDIKVWATLPDGTDKPLVWIKDWDFNWQATYFLKEPLAAPKGTKIHLEAYYDNSDQNPRNPNKGHLRSVTWGEQTTDEMCVAFITTTRDNEHLAIKPPASPTQTAKSN